MKILVTGGSGQLGSELKEIVNSGKEIYDHVKSDPLDYFFTDSKSLDITDHNTFEQFIIDNDISIIINCAAYTAVDKAETDVQFADKINHLAVANMATIAKQYSVRIIHISTDYVFDGENYKPYIETDITNPQSIYGSTKLAGERALQSINPKNAIIIRTSWVYSYYGNNFVKNMMKLGQSRDSLTVIFDQIGAPTYAKDLALAILSIVSTRSRHDNDKNRVEIYNYSNEGVTSWYDFAKAIMDMANINCIVNSIETVDYHTPAKRPHYSLLNKKKIKNTYNITIPYWKDSLKDCIRRLEDNRII